MPGLTIRANCPNTHMTKLSAERACAEKGAALWLRACGQKATLFFVNPTTGRQNRKHFRVEKVLF